MDENKLLKMFKLREDILMALEEGILAIDKNKKVILTKNSEVIEQINYDTGGRPCMVYFMK